MTTVDDHRAGEPCPSAAAAALARSGKPQYLAELTKIGQHRRTGFPPLSRRHSGLPRTISLPVAWTWVETFSTGRERYRNESHETVRGGELGLVIAPNGDILTVNGGNGKLVEVTPSGAQIAVRWLDKSGSPPGAGALFGLAVKPGHDAVYYVDDATNTLNLLHH
jgi:hypothetical protein